MLGLFFAKLIAAIFFLVDDIRRVIQWVAGKLFFQKTEGENLQQAKEFLVRYFLAGQV